jgi:hypothetical protein
LHWQILNFHGDALPSRRFENIANFVLTWILATKGGLGNNEPVTPGQACDADFVTEKLVLQLKTSEIFGGGSTTDSKFSSGQE